MNRQKADFITGLFVIFAVIGVVFVALRAANIADITSADGYRVRVHFDNIGGLVKRAPVKSAGVLVGRVKDIAYDDGEHIAIVEVVINDAYQFPADSLFSIVSSNLLGGQYVAIEVGGDEAMLQDNDVSQGNSAIVLEELISKFLFNEAGE